MGNLATSVGQITNVNDPSDWIFTSNGRLELIGTCDEILVAEMRAWCHPVFADGYRCGRQVAFQQGEEEAILFTDAELTILIDEHLPATVPAALIDEWRRGFVCGCVMVWYDPVPEFETEERQATETEDHPY